MASHDVLDTTAEGPESVAGAPPTRLALKEWAAAIHALLERRQTILLRKGGIHEKAFTTPAGDGGFLLFPTVAHAHAERTRPEHRDLITSAAADAEQDTVTIRAAVHLTGTVEVVDPARLPDLEDLHIWTSASITRDRVDFRPTKPLTVMVVEAVALDQPIVLPRLDGYGGCTSWIDLHTDVAIPPPAATGSGRRNSADVLARVRDTVG